MEETTILDRIRKLNALAERAGTEEEAALAASRVAELCRKYNLELGSVLIREREKKATKGKKAHGGIWEMHRGTLAQACDELFDTGHYRSRAPYVDGKHQNGWEVVFYGLKASVEAAIITYSYLEESVEAMLWGAVKRKEGVFGIPGANRTQTRSYRLGCGMRILHEAQKHARLQKGQVEGSTETQAIVLIGNQLKEQVVKEMKIKKGGHYKAAGDRAAYSAGYAAGGRIDLHGARSNRMLKG